MIKLAKAPFAITTLSNVVNFYDAAWWICSNSASELECTAALGIFRLLANLSYLPILSIAS